MNLFDIVKRRDHLAHFDQSLVLAHEVLGPDGRERCVDIQAGGELLLNRAELVSSLRTFPHTPGWTMRPTTDADAIVEIGLLFQGRQHATVCRRKVSVRSGPAELQLNWPISAAAKTGFSLAVRNVGSEVVRIAVGPSYTARPVLLEQLKGSGVEVGPGMNPQVMPRHGLEVKYVESMSGEDWARVYAKTQNEDRKMDELWGRYVVASAHDLWSFQDESLDFVFSNHVFEHLPNPLGVLENWRRKLKRGGVVAGVVPDARFTFDLRQPLSTISECEDEYARSCFQLERRHYERWCEYTAPYNTVDDLIARGYSVHAKYYSSDTFRTVLERSAAICGWSEIYLNATRNGKDFGFLLRK